MSNDFFKTVFMELFEYIINKDASRCLYINGSDLFLCDPFLWTPFFDPFLSGEAVGIEKGIEIVIEQGIGARYRANSKNDSLKTDTTRCQHRSRRRCDGVKHHCDRTPC